MKKILVLVLTVALIMGLSGCMYAMEGIVVNEDGSGEISEEILFQAEAYDALMAVLTEQGYVGVDFFNGQTPEITVIDDEEYYHTFTQATFSNLEELETILSENYKDVYVSESGIRFVMDMRDEMDMSFEEVQSAFSELGVDAKNVLTGAFRFSMPGQMIKCSESGAISDDGKIAGFIYDFEQMYQPQDVMVSTKAEKTKPSMSVTHKKTYKNAKTVTVSDESGIQEAKYKKKDGKYVSFDMSRTFTKNGTYTVTAKDYYGNKRTRTFTLKDETKPKVKGVSNNKTYTSERVLTFSDNCEISSVTLYINGEKIRLVKDMIDYGVPVSEPADYKVFIKDVNGNSRTVKFKIK